jgi:hypothetical protein
MDATHLPFERHAAEQLLRQQDEIARRWLSRVGAELRATSRRTSSVEKPLLDGMPRVLHQIAEFVLTADERTFAASQDVVESLVALARLRRSEGRDLRELIRELDILAEGLDGACLSWLESYPAVPPPAARRGRARGGPAEPCPHPDGRDLRRGIPRGRG